jgi:hypothetical protein
MFVNLTAIVLITLVILISFFCAAIVVWRQKKVIASYQKRCQRKVEENELRTPRTKKEEKCEHPFYYRNTGGGAFIEDESELEKYHERLQQRLQLCWPKK